MYHVAASPWSEERAEAAGKRLLLVEDDPCQAKIMAQALTAFLPAVEVDLAHTAEEALSLGRDGGPYHVVLTDGDLGGTTAGWHVAAELRQRGYGGMMVYLGESELPEDSFEPYNAVTCKGGFEFVRTVKGLLRLMALNEAARRAD